MQKRALLTIATLALLAPGTAEAHVKQKCSTKMEVRALHKCQTKNLGHSQFVYKFAKKHKIRNHEAWWHWKAIRWQKREYRETKRKLEPQIRYLSAWLCIHKYEGSWQDPHAPYYGGLQMDLTFQRTYAPELLRTKGTADNWTPKEQMLVAERAHRSGRGFYPWPNTARKCGLI